MFKNPVKIQPIRSNPVNFFWLVIRFRSGSGQNDPNPVRFRFGQNFRSGRTMFVTINGIHSMLALVLSGVPQRSVLGPILFLFHINDLQCHLKGSTAGSFADDTRLSNQVSSCDDVFILQEDLNTVVKWATENNMVLHDSL